MFQDMPNEFLSELCMYVVRFIFSPGEVIIYRDEPVHEIYIVHRGTCQVCTVYTRYTTLADPEVGSRGRLGVWGLCRQRVQGRIPPDSPAGTLPPLEVLEASTPSPPT